MKKKEIDMFIEEMEEIGDVWEPEDVERVYGDTSLDEALEDRKTSIRSFFDIIGTILRRGSCERYSYRCTRR